MNFHYSDGIKNYGELSHQEISSRMTAQPGGTHLVWQEGWMEWRPAHEVLSVGTSIPSLELYHYSDGTERIGALSEADVRLRMAANPGATHLVWKEGWSSWRNAALVLTPGDQTTSFSNASTE